MEKFLMLCNRNRVLFMSGTPVSNDPNQLIVYAIAADRRRPYGASDLLNW